MDVENAKAERDFRLNPPGSAPGQGSDDEWNDLDMGSSSIDSMGSVGTPSGSILDTLNSPSLGGMPGVQPLGGMPGVSGGQTKSKEDIMWDLAVQSGKGIFKYFKYLMLSLKNNTAKDWHDLGEFMFRVGLVCICVGFGLNLIFFFAKSPSNSWDLVAGAGVSTIVASILMCKNSGKGKSKNEEVKEEPKKDDLFGDSNPFSDISIPESEPEEDFIEEEPVEEEVSVWEDLLDDDDVEEYEEYEEDTNSVEFGSFDVNSAVGELPEIQQGTQTRQYLFESFMKVLPKVTPDFADMYEISEDTDEFYEFENYLRGAAAQVGTKEENYPELNSVVENQFLYRLTCSRPVGIKEQAIADEIAKAYARDEYNMEIRTGVYATVETSIGAYTINLFKGTYKDEAKKKNIVVSLGDIYKNTSEYILNPSVQMPFVWGVNEFGKAWVCDLIDNNSIIISGEPRGGKSWKGQSIVAQLAMYSSPKEVEFYIFDGKDRASDYRYLSTVIPHVRYFCGNQDMIVPGIEKVLEKAEKERGKILADSGYINVKDYNKDHPTEKIPYMYVVVDEMMGLMEYFNVNDKKEEANKFKGLLSTMVSKLAYAGVRFILFPHRIVDTVISKNTYSLVSCRAVVCQPNMDALKAAVDVTKRTFPYDLVQKGDMALKTKEIEDGKVVFCHAEILTSSNETNKTLFDYIGAVWGKLEPECKCITIDGSIGGSIYGNSASAVKLEKQSETIDHTVGKPSYEYKGYTQATALNSPDEDIDIFDDDLEDENFWDNYDIDD